MPLTSTLIRGVSLWVWLQHMDYLRDDFLDQIALEAIGSEDLSYKVDLPIQFQTFETDKNLVLWGNTQVLVLIAECVSLNPNCSGLKIWVKFKNCH